MLRLVCIDLLEKAEANKIHINRILNKSNSFIPESGVKLALKQFSILNEINELGGGWYEVNSPIFIRVQNISIGLSGQSLSKIYPNCYSEQIKSNSIGLSEFLGPPFNFTGKQKSIMFVRDFPLDSGALSIGDLYWTDANGSDRGPNWLPITSNINKNFEGLVRIKNQYFPEFYLKNAGKAYAITSSEAYELASLKDYLKGRKYPLELSFYKNFFDIKPLRYIPLSLKKLLFMLSSYLIEDTQSLTYRLSEKSLEELKAVANAYIKIIKRK